MAYLGMRRRHAFFMDSRGRNLDEYLWHMNDTNQLVLIFYFPGAKLPTLAKEASKYAKLYPFDVIYVAGGINHVTVKDKVTRVTTYEWQSEKALTTLLIERINQVGKFLHKNHPATKFVFCALAGVDLVRVVPCPKDIDQVNVDNAVWNFNIELIRKHERTGLYHPRLDRPIHRTARGSRKNYYHHLVDGLHPTEMTLYYWAKEIIKAIQHN